MKIGVIVVFLLSAGILLILVFFRRRARDSTPVGDMFIAAAPESEARAAKLLPTTGSEDQSSLLKIPDLPVVPEGDENFQPDPKVDWAVTATFPPGTKLEKAVLLGGFSQKWLQKHGSPEIYGKGATDGLWTFVRAGGSPDFYTELAFAWRLVIDSEESAEPVSAADLVTYLAALRDRLSVLGEPDLKPSSSPEAAALAARGLVELKTECGFQAVVVLNAPPEFPFDGRKIWDVMLSLGLKWGNMDLFHWVNSTEIGDDSFFSVETSTAPGYFLPEQVAANQVRTADLIFAFSVPRCAVPQSVFASMVKTAEYAKQRLGGELLDGDRRPLDVARGQKEIGAIEERLKAAGFQSGQGSTLYVF